jgi:hypothetical protein
VPETNVFQDLIARVRASDESAATELVRTYESHIRRAVRIHLVDRRLERLLDSMDICQSVFQSFFFQAALGQYELQTPDQLLRLLVTMARNKLSNEAKKQRRARRDPVRFQFVLCFAPAHMVDAGAARVAPERRFCLALFAS